MKLCMFCMIISLVGCAKTYHSVVRPTIMLAGLPIRLTVDAVKYPVGVVMQKRGDTTPFLQPLTIQHEHRKIVIGNAQRKDSFTIAVKADGSMWSWGQCANGELGLGLLNDTKLTPVKIEIQKSIVAVEAGRSHVLALTNSGEVFGWGRNEFGQLGEMASTSIPAKIEGLENIIAISANENFSLALDHQGKVYAFGKNAAIFNEADFRQSHFKPIVVYQDPNIAKIGTLWKSFGVYAITKNGEVILWDSEKNWLVKAASDYVGKDNSIPLVNPRITLSQPIVDVAFSSRATYYFLLADGSILAKGWQASTKNSFANNQDERSQFLKVKNLGHIVNVESSTEGLALDDKGKVWTWGHKIGVSSWVGLYRKSYLTRQPSIDNIVQIYRYYPSYIALTKEGDVYEWGIPKKPPSKISWQWK